MDSRWIPSDGVLEVLKWEYFSTRGYETSLQSRYTHGCKRLHYNRCKWSKFIISNSSTYPLKKLKRMLTSAGNTKYLTILDCLKTSMSTSMRRLLLTRIVFLVRCFSILRLWFPPYWGSSSRRTSGGTSYVGGGSTFKSTTFRGGRGVRGGGVILTISYRISNCLNG